MKKKLKVCVHCGHEHKTAPKTVKTTIAMTEYDQWACIKCHGTMNEVVVVKKTVKIDLKKVAAEMAMTESEELSNVVVEEVDDK